MIYFTWAALRTFGNHSAAHLTSPFPSVDWHPKDPLHQYHPGLISGFIFIKTLGIEMSFSLQTMFEMIASGLSEDSNTNVKPTPSSALLLLGPLAY